MSPKVYESYFREYLGGRKNKCGPGPKGLQAVYVPDLGPERSPENF